MIERFFGGFWNYYIYKFRFCIIVIFLIWLIISMSIAVDIGPLTESEQYLSSDHYLMVVQNKIKENFSGQGARLIKVFVFWGVKSIDNKGMDKWDPTQLGEIVWDDTFNIYSEEAQIQMM